MVNSSKTLILVAICVFAVCVSFVKFTKTSDCNFGNSRTSRCAIRHHDTKFIRIYQTRSLNNDYRYSRSCHLRVVWFAEAEVYFADTEEVGQKRELLLSTRYGVFEYQNGI